MGEAGELNEHNTVSGASIAPCSTSRTASHSARRSYQTIEQLQADLDAWISATGCSRGGWCCGKTPMQTLVDASHWPTRG
jgi:hypothetical protein